MFKRLVCPLDVSETLSRRTCAIELNTVWRLLGRIKLLAGILRVRPQAWRACAAVPCASAATFLSRLDLCDLRREGFTYLAFVPGCIRPRVPLVLHLYQHRDWTQARLGACLETRVLGSGAQRRGSRSSCLVPRRVQLY